MIIINLRGGLGNQMFQIAFGKYLEKQYGFSVSYSRFYMRKEKGYKNHYNSYQNINSRNIKMLPFALDIIVSIYYRLKYEFFKVTHKSCDNYYTIMQNYSILKTEKVYDYIPIDFKNTHYFDMYFQNINYLAGISPEIINEMEISADYKPNEENVKILRLIEKCENPVCVHIRRGDYLNDENKNLVVCTKKYYENSIGEIMSRVQNPTFFIFSNNHDEIQWIKKNYNIPVKSVYVDLGNKDFEELYLMSKCRHFILSNSSFSWWAQKLSKTREVIIAPSIWIKDDPNSSGIYEDGWVLINP